MCTCMCIRERLRAVSTVRRVHSGSGAQYLSLSAWMRSTLRAILPAHPKHRHQDNTRPTERTTGAGGAARAGRHYTQPTPIRGANSCRRAVRGYFCVFKTIKHQLALVSVYKKWESAPAPLLSIAHISRALHKDSASVDNRRWAWRAGT